MTKMNSMKTRAVNGAPLFVLTRAKVESASLGQVRCLFREKLSSPFHCLLLLLVSSQSSFLVSTATLQLATPLANWTHFAADESFSSDPAFTLGSSCTSSHVFSPNNPILGGHR